MKNDLGRNCQYYVPVNQISYRTIQEGFICQLPCEHSQLFISELQELKKAEVESSGSEPQTDPGGSMEASSAVDKGAGTGDDQKPDGETVITGSGDVEEK